MIYVQSYCTYLHTKCESWLVNTYLSDHNLPYLSVDQFALREIDEPIANKLWNSIGNMGDVR